MTRWWVLLTLPALMGIGCEEPRTPEPKMTASAAVEAFEAPKPEVVGLVELREAQKQVIEQVLARHGIQAASVEIRLDDALNLEVTGPTGIRCSRKVPGAFVPAELVTNFDHTLDHCLRDVIATP